jgi:hypothetical protein
MAAVWLEKRGEARREGFYWHLDCPRKNLYRNHLSLKLKRCSSSPPHPLFFGQSPDSYDKLEMGYKNF